MDKKKTKKKSILKKNDKAQEYLFGWQRTQADFENYKKQTEKRIKDIIEFGNAGLLLDFLPLYSHFKSALKHIPEEQKEEGWCQGLGHIKKLWEDLFAKFNVQEIKTVGEEFNHNEHEAVEHEEDKEKKDHIILKEIQAGYKLNDKIIQPARVVVNKINKE
jgi:molecular chaperone GrpE